MKDENRIGTFARKKIAMRAKIEDGTCLKLKSGVENS
jgi:hypothetical protein